MQNESSYNFHRRWEPFFYKCLIFLLKQKKLLHLSLYMLSVINIHLNLNLYVQFIMRIIGLGKRHPTLSMFYINNVQITYVIFVDFPLKYAI